MHKLNDTYTLLTPLSSTLGNLPLLALDMSSAQCSPRISNHMSGSKQDIKNGTSDLCTVPLLPCSTALLLVFLSLPLPNDKRVISLSLHVTECWPSHRTVFHLAPVRRVVYWLYLEPDSLVGGLLYSSITDISMIVEFIQDLSFENHK